MRLFYRDQGNVVKFLRRERSILMHLSQLLAQIWYGHLKPAQFEFRFRVSKAEIEGGQNRALVFQCGRELGSIRNS